MTEVSALNNKMVSVVIPVFNSEKTLPDLYKRLTEQFGRVSPNYEIIFVDDCSVDGSS